MGNHTRVDKRSRQDPDPPDGRAVEFALELDDAGANEEQSTTAEGIRRVHLVLTGG